MLRAFIAATFILGTGIAYAENIDHGKAPDPLGESLPFLRPQLERPTLPPFEARQNQRVAETVDQIGQSASQTLVALEKRLEKVKPWMVPISVEDRVARLVAELKIATKDKLTTEERLKTIAVALGQEGRAPKDGKAFTALELKDWVDDLELRHILRSPSPRIAELGLRLFLISHQIDDLYRRFGLKAKVPLTGAEKLAEIEQAALAGQEAVDEALKATGLTPAGSVWETLPLLEKKLGIEKPEAYWFYRLKELRKAADRYPSPKAPLFQMPGNTAVPNPFSHPQGQRRDQQFPTIRSIPPARPDGPTNPFGRFEQ